MGKLLIVEDSQMLCRVFEDLLKKYTNFTFDIATTYQEAETFLHNTRYEFAVAAMHLPDAHSGEIISLLNKHNIAPIVFTGIFDEDFRDGFESANIVDYVLKERYENIIYVIEKLRQLESNKNKLILVVDDSSLYANYVKQNLVIHRFKVLTASNGIEALKKLEMHPEIELIITDFHMPLMDGLELVRQVRKKRTKKDLSIVVLTSETNSYTTSRFLKDGANDYITKPFSRDEFYARIYHNIETIELFDTIRSGFDEDIIMLLSDITEFRSAETGSHVKRISEYSYILAKLLGIYEDEAKIIAKMSVLHDIGKITVADRILCKPGKLTEAEFSEMKLHTTKGEQLIQRAFHSDPKIGKIATDIALYHHEKYDGSGYPHELSGEAIPLSARIVSLVDVFDALINKRVYKDSWHINDVLHYIKEHSGTQFDPKIVQLFLNNSDCFLNVLNKYSEDKVQERPCSIRIGE